MSIKIALAGNPNCGKTTLFNNLTGSNQYVGNWPGRYVARPYALTRWYQLEKLLDEQQAAQAETPAEAPAQISET